MVSLLRESFNKWFAEKARDVEGDVLNVGSGGEGWGGVRMYGPLMPKISKMTTTDIARRKVDVIADARSMPIASSRFDCVVSTFVMQYIAPLQPAVDEVYRLLKPGGVFLTNFHFDGGNRFTRENVGSYLSRFSDTEVDEWPWASRDDRDPCRDPTSRCVTYFVRAVK